MTESSMTFSDKGGSVVFFALPRAVALLDFDQRGGGSCNFFNFEKSSLTPPCHMNNERSLRINNNNLQAYLHKEEVNCEKCGVLESTEHFFTLVDRAHL